MPAGGIGNRAAVRRFIRRTTKRMIQVKHIVTAFLIAACLLGTSQAATADAEPRGRAYLFRGLIGLIDWGMDELAARITRTGVAANIGSHLAWRDGANQAIADLKP